MKPLLLAVAWVTALAIACGGADFDSGRSDGAGSAGDASAVAPDTGSPPLAADNATAAQSRIVVNTNLDIEVDDLTATYAAARGLARDAGGFVAEGRITDSEEATTGFVRLRVPVGEHDRVLGELRGLGEKVVREESNAREVTAEYTDLQSRLVNLQRAEEQYQTLMGRAGSIDEVLKVTSRLDEVRGEIEQVQGRINLIESQSDFATIALALSVPPVPASTDLPSPVRMFVEAAEASVVMAHLVLNVAAVIAVVAIWGLPLLAGYVFLRRPLMRAVQASRRRLT
jgi:hypothetical protein